MSNKMDSYWSYQRHEVAQQLGIRNPNGTIKYHNYTPQETQQIDAFIEALQKRLDLRDVDGKQLQVGCRVAVHCGRGGFEVGVIKEIDVDKGILIERKNYAGKTRKSRFGEPTNLAIIQ